MIRRHLLQALACLAALTFASTCVAQIAQRALQIVVTVPPGGAPDILARALGERLGAAFGQPVIVENRPGSNGNIAAEQVARSRADGHTLLLAPDSLFVVNPYLYARMPIDLQRDLVPVSALAAHDFMLAVHPSLAAASLAEFVALARDARPPLAYASGGNGSLHHLAMERLKQATGIDLLHVPYRGGAAAAAGTASGEVSATMAAPSAFALIRAGRMRSLAVTGPSRLAAFPDLPALSETYPDLVVSAWIGMFAPAGTPQAVLERLHAQVGRSLAEPGMHELLERAGAMRPLALSRAAFAELIRSDGERLRPLIARLGLRID